MGGRYGGDGGTVTTLAQPATACKGFGNTRYGGASGICQSPSGGIHGDEKPTRGGAQVVGIVRVLGEAGALGPGFGRTFDNAAFQRVAERPVPAEL
ncbi:hypothetical protein Srubr_03460 [Streptomyces rubradiris]|uniref:Uncharacterized protein n=1 Tax=Streptomyces rubradiris TaxID=285531 RepID=A0ABQ3R3T2_STRRR|nr:hypothetical protein GCM10018792_22520 [Streptomyces rubradiris]GHI50500.1 hypothetical protein Srubr_03460 [Streptomyces rubradiris]